MDRRPCVQCDGGDDDELILLCDACDQPWHAMCVGFKGPVLGDWLCEECSEIDQDMKVKKARMSGACSRKRARPT
eukprot:7381846-Prymnesium_polylepis.1